jgi:aminomethyltransferase
MHQQGASPGRAFSTAADVEMQSAKLASLNSFQPDTASWCDTIQSSQSATPLNRNADLAMDYNADLAKLLSRNAVTMHEILRQDVDPAQAGIVTSEEIDALALKPAQCHKIPDIALGTRIRKSCYFDATLAFGAQKFTTYNHMLLATFFHPDEYEALKNDVCLWDVAAQRQVELAGPDALKMAQLITPRALDDMKIGDCRYAVTTDDDGLVTNDPVVLKIDEDRFWFSVADSDLILWVKGIAWALSLDVQIEEAAVSPCALQGPKSVLLLQDLFGQWVGDLKYYKFQQTHLDGIPIVLARSGWSPERGYELYLQDESRGEELWHRLMEAGHKYNIRPGVPNQTRRIEGGMLSYGADINLHNALELGLPSRMVSKTADFIGKEALGRIEADGGPKRMVVGIRLTYQEPLHLQFIRPSRLLDGHSECIGNVTSFCWSPHFGANLGIATVPIEAAKVGTRVRMQTPDGLYEGFVQKLPFMKRM